MVWYGIVSNNIVYYSISRPLLRPIPRRNSDEREPRVEKFGDLAPSGVDSPLTPNLPTNIIPTNIAWLKLSGNFPMGLGIPPLNIKIVLESNPPKPTMLVGRLGARRETLASRLWSNLGARNFQSRTRPLRASRLLLSRPPELPESHLGARSLLKSSVRSGGPRLRSC